MIAEDEKSGGSELMLARQMPVVLQAHPVMVTAVARWTSHRKESLRQTMPFSRTLRRYIIDSGMYGPSDTAQATARFTPCNARPVLNGTSVQKPHDVTSSHLLWAPVNRKTGDL